MAKIRGMSAVFLLVLVFIGLCFAPNLIRTESAAPTAHTKSALQRTSALLVASVALLSELSEVQVESNESEKEPSGFFAALDAMLGGTDHFQNQPAVRASFDVRTVLFRFLRSSQRLFDSH